MANAPTISDKNEQFEETYIDDIQAISYTVSQAANLLGMKQPTFKKYYNLIERYSKHKFRRSDQGLVMFNDDDIGMLFRFKELRKEPKMTLEKACEILVEEFELDDAGKTSNFSYDPPQHQSSNEVLNLIHEQSKALQQQGQTLQQQGLLLSELTKQLQEARTQTPILIEEAVKSKQKEMESARDEQLMTVLREIQWVKKEIAESKKRRGVWNNLKGIFGFGGN